MSDKNQMDSFLFKKLDSLRGKAEFNSYKSSPHNLLKIGNAFGKEVLNNILSDIELLNNLNSVYLNLNYPDHLFDFILLLLSKNNFQNYLDPWVTPISPLLLSKKESYGYVINPTNYEIVTDVLKVDRDKVALGDPLYLLENEEKEFDCICSMPPFGYRTKRNGKNVDFSLELFVDSSKKLSKNGVLIFLFPLSFCFKQSIKERLSIEKIFIEGIFFLEPGSHFPSTGIGSCLVIASNQKNEKTFVANLKNKEINEIVFNNFSKSIEHKQIQLGKLVDFQKFVSMDQLIYQKKLIELEQITGNKPIKLKSITKGSRTLNSDRKIEETPNTIYIPKIGNSDVVYKPQDFKIKQHNYILFELDDSVSSIYISSYLNSKIGRETLDSVLTGSTILIRSMKNLLEINLFISQEISIQERFIENDIKFKNLILSVNELKNKLWDNPRKLLEVEKNIASFEKDNSIEKWIKELPFPLASVLWKYHSTINKEKKITHLLHFFEIIPEFISIMILSCFRNRPEFIQEHKSSWVSEGEKYSEWIKQSSFGGWNNLFSNLSKLIRIKLNSNKEDEKESFKKILGNPSQDFINFITKKDVVNTLEAVCNFRNKWKGHGPDVSQKIIQDRLNLLQEQLTQLRENIKSSFDSLKIISPGKSEYSDNTYKYEVKELRGTTTPFFQTEIKSNIPLEVSKLYLVHSFSYEPIELIPFIKYKSQEKALYFYSSIEFNQVRYISYHYEDKPEIHDELKDNFNKALKLLMKNSS